MRAAALSSTVRRSDGGVFTDDQQHDGRFASAVDPAVVTLTLGIANTLIIDVLDRRRELGLWRALGLRGRQVASSVVIEVAVVVGLISALAVLMGMYNNYVNTLSMGEVFAIRFVLSPDEVALSLALLCGAAICASYWPARQAGHVDVLAALRDE